MTEARPHRVRRVMPNKSLTRCRRTVVVLCLAVAAQAQAQAPADVAASTSANERVERAAAQLERPLVFGERYPGLRFLAYLFADEVQPHLRAIAELARSGDPRAAPALVSVLRDPESPYRFEAGVALTHVPSAVSIAPLIRLLDAGEPRLGRMAARALGLVAAGLAVQSEPSPADGARARESAAGIRQARDALVRVLDRDTDPVMRVAALHGLVSLGGEEALSSVFDVASKDPHFLVRCALLSSTGAFASQPRGARIAPAQLRAILRRSIDTQAIDAPPGVWTRAYYGSLYNSKVVPESERESDCIDVNETAMRWLASLKDPSVVPALLRAAASSDPELRATAAWGLARFDDERAFAGVVGALSSPYWGVRKAAIEGLGRSRRRDADARLVATLRAGSRLDRREAARALAGSFGASLALIGAFSDIAVEVRDAAESALLRSDIVVGKIERALADTSRETPAPGAEDAFERRRRRLQEGLEKWKLERRAVEVALARGLAAGDRRVRVRSARVLSRYESGESLALLLAALETGLSPQSESAALALGLRGDVRARQALERAALDAREELAVAAIRALQDLRRTESLATLRRLQSRQTSARVETATRYAIAVLERL